MRLEVQKSQKQVLMFQLYRRTLEVFSGCGVKPSFPSTSAGDLRELPTVPLRGEGCCVVGRASRDSAGFGAMEEGLISRGGRNLRLPLGFGL